MNLFYSNFTGIIVRFLVLVSLVAPWLPAGAEVNQVQPRPSRRGSAEILTFDANEKRLKTSPGDKEAKFLFTAMNSTDKPVIIEDVQTSCGCTSVVKKSPWVIGPGKSDTLEIRMDLLGRQGIVTKSVYIFTDSGVQTLKVISEIPPNDNSGVVEPSALNDRQRNQLKALRDRQIVFRGDCARCHAKPTEGLTGAKLYERGCGICHNSPNRASMVPDLAKIQKNKDKLYWEVWIKYGRKGSLMPAFHHSQGGPLNDAQVDSLVSYLLTEVPADAMEVPHDQKMELEKNAQKSESSDSRNADESAFLFDEFDLLKPTGSVEP